MIPIEQKRKHLTQNWGAIRILGPLLSTALISLGSGFISRIFNRGKSKFVKQVLVEKGEYDRLRQQQFRDYSPEVRVMGTLQEEMLTKLKDKSLAAQTRLDLVSGLLQRFKKLKKETNTLSGATDAKNVAVPDGPKVETVKKNKEKPKQKPPK